MKTKTKAKVTPKITKKIATPKAKSPNLVSINQPRPANPVFAKARLVASDEATHRIIIGIGGQRIAYDMTSRITRLPPNTGDHPAPIIPMKNPADKKRPAEGK